MSIKNIITIYSDDDRFLLSVKIEWFHRWRIEKANIYDLVNIYKIKDYLHNDQGPAIVDRVGGTCQYWLDGKLVSDTIFKEKQQFFETMEDILNNE